MTFCLEQARLILERDLYLGILDIPTFRLSELSDNWDARAPGLSFLDDPRNAELLDPFRDWLQREIAQRPDLYSQIFHHDPTYPANDTVRSKFTV